MKISLKKKTIFIIFILVVSIIACLTYALMQGFGVVWLNDGAEVEEEFGSVVLDPVYDPARDESSATEYDPKRDSASTEEYDPSRDL